MQQRIAHLQSNPGDVNTLRAWLPLGAGQAQADRPKEAGPDRHEEMAVDKPFSPWPDEDDDGPLDGSAPDGHAEPMGEVQAAPDPLAALPVLPTRFARQRPDTLPGAASAESAPDAPRLRLRLFGKAAAHTLEVIHHRRGGDFMGMHVVSIDSAHALGAGGGYAWERKLVIQLMPEEMPAVIATLMGLTP